MNPDIADPISSATSKPKIQFKFQPTANNWFICSVCKARVKHVFRLEGHARKHLDGTIKTVKGK
jgi:hypothetical protein